MSDQSNHEDDLFPIATPAWIRHKARMRRAAKRAHALRLSREGAKLTDLGAKWTEDYFQPILQQERLF